MSYGWWFLVIFLTALVTYLGIAVLTSRAPRIPLARLADPAPLPGELNPYCPDNIPGCNISHAGYPRPADSYGPFPVDTSPLLILSEKDAANAALAREIPRLCAEAEAKIPPRWR